MNFDPEGSGYDYARALAAGMRPGANKHWGSVAPATPDDMAQGVPPDSYAMLKGHAHPTWNLGMEGELERGSDVQQLNGRYFSVPGAAQPNGELEMIIQALRGGR